MGRGYRREATTREKVVQVLLGFVVVGVFTLIALIALVVVVKVMLPGH